MSGWLFRLSMYVCINELAFRGGPFLNLIATTANSFLDKTNHPQPLITLWTGKEEALHSLQDTIWPSHCLTVSFYGRCHLCKHLVLHWYLINIWDLFGSKRAEMSMANSQGNSSNWNVHQAGRHLQVVAVGSKAAHTSTETCRPEI